MTDHVGVRPADLVTHAHHIEAVGDGVEAAAGAGAAVRAGNAAYGQLCSFVPAMLNGLQDVLVEGFRATAQSLHDTGARLRTTADDYERVDQIRATAFDQVGTDR